MVERNQQSDDGGSLLQSMVQKYNATIDRAVEDVLLPYGTRIAFLTYAFVFFYYGFLKVQALFSGLTTPVRGEVGALVNILGLPEIGITLTAVMVFVGLYEMGLGVLFFFKKIRAAFFLFLGHQLVTLLGLVIARTAYFKAPFLMGTIPWLFDAFAAYILKNTIFIGGFLVLAAVELGKRHPELATSEGAKNKSQMSAD